MTVRHENGYHFIQAGKGPNMLLLHGLFGALSNWDDLIRQFSANYTIWVPVLPIYDLEAKVEPTVEALRDHVIRFCDAFRIHDAHVIGNSLGGHVAIMLTLQKPQCVQTLTLTGSSGLFEAGMGSGLPRRSDYNYIKERVEFTFYDPKIATKELVDECFGIVNNADKAIRVIRVARAAQRMNMKEELKTITTRTCLIWGLNDNITPPYVAHEFRRLMPNAHLHFIDRCGHAPMMEQPQPFNDLVAHFLQSVSKPPNKMAYVRV